MSAHFSAPAPAVRGHSAFWAGSSLVWAYARGGWAVLSAPVADSNALRHDKALQGQAIKIAANLRIGVATPPIVFPAQLTGPTSQWQLHDVYYLAGGGVLQAESYTLTTGTSRYFRHVGDLGIWTNAPYFEIPRLPAPAAAPHTRAIKNTSEIINGYHVVVKRRAVGGHPKQELCPPTPMGSASTSSSTAPTPPSA